MRISSRFINFALFSSTAFFAWALSSCKGRTIDNVEPTGDTIEVVIMEETTSDSIPLNPVDDPVNR